MCTNLVKQTLHEVLNTHPMNILNMLKKKNKTDSFGFTDFEALKGSPPLGSTMVLRFSRLDPSWIGQEALTTLLQALQFQGRSVPFRGCQNLARSGTSSVALCDLTTRKMVI